jgi:allantoinase
VETCPHYLNFAAEDVPDGATEYKCAPPLRPRANQERLWAAVEAGEIDSIGTDHSPSPPDMKHLEDGDFMKAWGGISGACKHPDNSALPGDMSNLD